MNMEPRLSYLLNQYLLDQLTDADRQELQALLAQEPQAAALEALVLQQLQTGLLVPEQAMPATEAKLLAAVQQQIQRQAATTTPVRRIGFRHQWRWIAAVCITVAGAAWGWLYYTGSLRTEVAVTKPAALDVAPGKAGALLTLADGSQVVLDSLGDGKLTTQNGTQVLIQQGKLVYQAAAQTGTGSAYNTMSTPKGRQYSVVLPDGTVVWMNAASTLRFPVSFNGNRRVVSLQGEAYFEVAANARQPFAVEVNGAAIEVLGTRFNVNSYADEKAIQTTLLDGAVQVVPEATGKAVLLQPGQQAQLVPGALPHMNVVTADIDKVMAWKNGLFNFNNTPVQEVMRQLERWYDIEVQYQNGIPNIQFVGAIGKDLTLSEALDIMKGANLHFRIEAGRRLVILP